jgi:hypothetical protein
MFGQMAHGENTFGGLCHGLKGGEDRSGWMVEVLIDGLYFMIRFMMAS